MKNKTVIIILYFMVNNCLSQTGEANDQKFILSISKGLTYNTDNVIFEKGEPLALSISNFNLNLTTLEFGYFITRQHEVGIGFGQNLFTVSDTFLTGMQYDNVDTTFSYSSGYKFVNMNWFSIYYNFHFQNTYKAGIKLGGLKPDFTERIYLSLSLGKYYKVSDNFLVDITLSYTSRNNSFKYFKSNQLNLSFGLNLKI